MSNYTLDTSNLEELKALKKEILLEEIADKTYKNLFLWQKLAPKKYKAVSGNYTLYIQERQGQAVLDVNIGSKSLLFSSVINEVVLDLFYVIDGVPTTENAHRNFLDALGEKRPGRCTRTTTFVGKGGMKLMPTTAKVNKIWPLVVGGQGGRDGLLLGAIEAPVDHGFYSKAAMKMGGAAEVTVFFGVESNGGLAISGVKDTLPQGNEVFVYVQGNLYSGFPDQLPAKLLRTNLNCPTIAVNPDLGIVYMAWLWHVVGGNFPTQQEVAYADWDTYYNSNFDGNLGFGGFYVSNPENLKDFAVHGDWFIGRLKDAANAISANRRFQYRRLSNPFTELAYNGSDAVDIKSVAIKDSNPAVTFGFTAVHIYVLSATTLGLRKPSQQGNSITNLVQVNVVADHIVYDPVNDRVFMYSELGGSIRWIKADLTGGIQTVPNSNNTLRKIHGMHVDGENQRIYTTTSLLATPSWKELRVINFDGTGDRVYASGTTSYEFGGLWVTSQNFIYNYGMIMDQQNPMPLIASGTAFVGRKLTKITASGGSKTHGNADVYVGHI